MPDTNESATARKGASRARGFPLIGILPSVLSDPLRCLTRLAHDHGGAVVSLPLGPVRAFMLTRPHHVAHVCNEHWRRYPKGQGGMYKVLRRVFGDSLATLDGDAWIADRRLLQPLFSRKNLDGLAGEMIAATEHSLDALAPRVARGEPLALNREMAVLSENVVLRALFGIALDHAEATELRAALMQAVDAMMKRLFLYFLPAALPLPGELALRRGLRRLDAGLLAQLRRKRIEAGPGSDLLSLLLGARDQTTGAPLADRHVRDELVTLFFGGHETSAVALTWTLYLLCRHPAVLEKLYAEIDAVLGARRATPAMLPELRYTRQVFQESLRLRTPGWLRPFSCAGGDVIDGCVVPAGATVLINAYALHRDPLLWERPGDFTPERFADSASWPRGQYIPFGAGPRQCIGDQFALMEGQLALAMFLQRFRPRLVTGEIQERGAGVMLRPARDVLVSCTPRSG